MSGLNGNGRLTTNHLSPLGLLPDPMVLNRLAGMMNGVVTNALSMSRAALAQRGTDPRRDVYKECGYPSTRDLSPQEYQDLYDREPVANRVCEVMPKESWQVQPMIYELADADEPTEFEAAWDRLGKTLRGEQSWYKDEQGSPVFEALLRADIQSGIGSFGVLLLGLDDGAPLGMPVGGGAMVNNAWSGGPMEHPVLVENYVDPKTKAPPTAEQLLGTDAQYVGVRFGPDSPPKRKKNLKLTFLRTFPESLVQIVQFEANLNSPRFGMPVRYAIQLNDPRDNHGGIGLPMATVYVHWSRVIHFADNLGSSEVFGVPRMRPVLNPVLDIQKVRGGSAEMYWLGAFPGLHLSTHPQLGGDVIIDQSAVRDTLEQWQNGLQRYGVWSGMAPQMLAPTVVDPTSQIQAQIESICIQLGIPIRVFKGSERGELASSQDDNAWNDRIKLRQNNYTTPRVLVPFVDRLIALGVLPEPTETDAETEELAASGKVATEVDEEGALKVAAGKQAPPEKKPPFGKGKSEAADARRKELTKNLRARGLLLEERRGRTMIVNAETGEDVGEVSEAGYSIEWPDVTSQSKAEKAAVLLQRTQAYAAYVSGGLEAIIPPVEYMTRFDDMDEDDALAMAEAGAELAAQRAEEEMEQQAQMIEKGLAPDPTDPSQQPPVKMGPGETLVNPADGKRIASTPPDKTKKPPVKNANPEGCNQYTGPGCGNKADPEARRHELMSMPKRQLARLVAERAGRKGVDPVAMAMPKSKLVRLAEVQEQASQAGRAMTLPEWRAAALATNCGIAVEVLNVFCPTGEGGGVDPTCSPGGAKAGGVGKEPKTPPPPGPAFKPHVEADHNRDGVTDAARVGVPAMAVPPPPKIGRLPNLTERERRVEAAFIDAYEAEPDKVAATFRSIAHQSKKPGEPVTFGTDDAKVLSSAWVNPDPSVQSKNRAELNLALHQTANAITKRAFLQELDSLQPGDRIMVTVGGCGAGKGFALKNVPQALEVKKQAKVVWDSAGDQNATENPWIQAEAERRGLKVDYVFVHADPKVSWAHPEAGVVKRAADPKDGRMVDAKVFADSYALGAKNHQAFMEQHKDNPSARFVILENKIGSKPRLLDAIPEEALRHDRAELARFAEGAILKGEVEAPPHVKRGALIGRRVWGAGS